MADRTDDDAAASSSPRPTQAALEIQGHVLRYGETARHGGEGPGTLRRLGTCEFDFDVAEAVFGNVAPKNFETVIEAVKEIFTDTKATTLRLAVHPPSLVSFFSPLPEDMSAAERHEQLRQEAALLADVNAAQPVRIRAVPVRSEEAGPAEEPEAHRWHHVMHVPEPVHARIMLMARGLGMGAYDLLDTTRMAANVVINLDRMASIPAVADHSDAPYSLVLGTYDHHAELGVVYDGTWYHGHHGPVGAPEDSAYFAAALLDRIGLGTSEVGRFLLYGDDAAPEDFQLLSDLLSQQPSLCDPLAVFGRSPAGVPRAQLSGYVPCVGALLM